MLSGDLFPAHPIMKENELLSSWLVRLAMENGVKLHSFMKLALPGFEVWNRDIDRSASMDLLRLLAQRTGQPLNHITQSTIQSYEGLIFEKCIINGHTPWIMPLKIYHRKHLSYGLVFCPLCLKEDPIPYFRKNWRLAYSVICEKHHQKLKDRCPQCEAVIAFHRNDFKDRNHFTKASITQCHVCGFDLSETHIEQKEDDRLIQLIGFLNTALRKGYIKINGQPVYSLLVFNVFHQLLKLLTLDRHGIKLRTFIESEIALPSLDGNNYKYPLFEMLPLQARRHTLILTAWLFEEWPTRFVESCQKIHLTKSRITKDMRNVPYWFNKELESNLDYRFHSPTETEIKEVIKYLEKKGKPISISSIEKQLGLRDSPRVIHHVRQLININEV